MKTEHIEQITPFGKQLVVSISPALDDLEEDAEWFELAFPCEELPQSYMASSKACRLNSTTLDTNLSLG